MMVAGHALSRSPPGRSPFGTHLVPISQAVLVRVRFVLAFSWFCRFAIDEKYVGSTFRFDQTFGSTDLPDYAKR